MLFKPFDYYIMRPPEEVRLLCLDLVDRLLRSGRQLGEVSESGEIIESQISKTNWNYDEVEDKSTLQLKMFFYDHLLEFYATHLKRRHRKDFDMKKIWYQVYKANSGDYHNWHDHLPTPSLSHVWYLKLPKGYGTEFKINGKVIKPRVKEGDLLVFPPDVLHRSPPNVSNQDKVIVSFNTHW